MMGGRLRNPALRPECSRHPANRDALDVPAPALVRVNVAPISAGRLATRVVAHKRPAALAADHLHRPRRRWYFTERRAGISQQADYLCRAHRLRAWQRDVDAPPALIRCPREHGTADLNVNEGALVLRAA